MLRRYLTLKISVQHSNFNNVNVLTTMQRYSRGHKTHYILEYQWIFYSLYVYARIPMAAIHLGAMKNQIEKTKFILFILKMV